ncbi:MAG: hypothetical protein QM645_02690 [Asticcacaulis sp.]
MERPNTVAGLIAKRSELAKLRKTLEAEVKKLTCDIDHLDAAIALFDSAQTPKSVQRYVTKHRAKKGSVTPFVVKFLREAKAPVTSRDITEAWIAERGLRTDDATFVILRKRIGAVLTKLRQQGLITGIVKGDYKAWSVV